MFNETVLISDNHVNFFRVSNQNPSLAFLASSVNSLARSKYCWQTIRKRSGRPIRILCLVHPLLNIWNHPPLVQTPHLSILATHRSIPGLPLLSHSPKTVMNATIGQPRMRTNGVASDYQMFSKHQAFGSCPYASTLPYLCPLCPLTSGVYWERTKRSLAVCTLNLQILLCGTALQTIQTGYPNPAIPDHHQPLLRRRDQCPEEPPYGNPCVHLLRPAPNWPLRLLPVIGPLGA